MYNIHVKHSSVHLYWVCEKTWYETPEATRKREAVHRLHLGQGFMNLQSSEQLEGGNLLGDPANMDLQGGGSITSLYNRIETLKTLNINLPDDV